MDAVSKQIFEMKITFERKIDELKESNQELKESNQELKQTVADQQFMITSTTHIADKVLPQTNENVEYILKDLPPHTNELYNIPKIKLPSTQDSEDKHQIQINALYSWILKSTNLCAHDTSKSGYLKDPVAKIDHTITRQGHNVLWSEVVLVSKVKSNIEKDHSNAFGQVIDRIIGTFKKQPSRFFMYGILLDCRRIEIVKVERHLPYRFYRTGLQPLLLSSKETGIGYSHLFRLLTAPLSLLGFDPFYLPTTSLIFNGASESLDKSTLTLDNHFQVLREGTNNHACICEAFYSKNSNGKTLWKSCVLKFSKIEDQILNEITILKKLNHKYIPQLLAYGDIKNYGLGLVIQPSGKLLSSLEDLSLERLLQYIENIDDALVYAHSQGFFHKDVSPKNIIVHDEKAILIDWGISKPVDEFSFYFSGTVMFCSLASLFSFLKKQEHYYESRDDFESLFYSLLDLIFRGHLPWTKKKSIEDLYSLKFMYMHHHWEDLVPVQPRDKEWKTIEVMHSLLFKCQKIMVSTLFEKKSIL